MIRIRLSAGVLAALVLGASGSGCSQFNMVPPCDQLGEGVALALIPNSLIPPGAQIDKPRVRAIVHIEDLREVSSAYNSRTCRGVIALNDNSDRFEATFLINQAEGARYWQEIKFLDHGNPDFDRLVGEVQQAYVGGSPH